jgi:cellulose synthase/poly-beta-1,6-N-acetylglucosamine synthase-like glycosyltransferase
VVTVPPGEIRTKPRALNYALDVARGRIIGVWDAEDAPEADQIDRVVAEFLRRDPKVACLQGRLAWYNARRNWLTRCFAIEYATWFRIVLPGLARIGWPVPLGGTSVFFRRAALEELGGWDAHNVTEDADLGLRLARRGYRTEIVDTITYEEATARLAPWIRQRSRWLKGYAMTYAVHMRSPRRLLADLGPWRFLGVQVVFLATLSQFVLAPLLWSFWPAAFGLWHPFGAVLPPDWPRAIALLFLGAEAVSLAVGLIAVSERGQRDMMPVVLTLSCYFPFATLAAAKAAWELAFRPFFWDKTAHGEGPDAPRA